MIKYILNLLLLLSFNASANQCLSTEQLEQSIVKVPQASVKQTINRFLKLNSDYRLLKFSDTNSNTQLDFSCAESPNLLVEEVKTYFNPWLLGDTNFDGIDDLVLSLYKKNSYSLLVFQGNKGGFKEKPYWLFKDIDKPFMTALINDGIIVPVFCYGCDTNPYFVWVGSDYDLDGYRLNSQVCLNIDAKLYKSFKSIKQLSTKVLTDITPAYVVGIGARIKDANSNKHNRWYKVKLLTNKKSVWYVKSNDFLNDDGECRSEDNEN